MPAPNTSLLSNAEIAAITKNIRKEYATNVLNRLNTIDPTFQKGFNAVASKHPSVVESAFSGTNIKSSVVNGMGEVNEYMSGWMDALTSVATKALDYGANRAIAQQTARDALKLEAEKMNLQLKHDQAAAALKAKTDGTAAKEAQAVALQQYQMETISKDIPIAKIPLYIGLAALAAAGFMWFRSRGKKKGGK
jgi:hypothetical protein